MNALVVGRIGRAISVPEQSVYVLCRLYISPARPVLLGIRLELLPVPARARLAVARASRMRHGGEARRVVREADNVLQQGLHAVHRVGERKA